MHSEIAEILETSSDLSQQLKALFDIFLSHPFAILLSDGAPSSGMSNFTSYKLSLNDWSERIRRLRNKAPSKSILSVVPELDSLLRIMMGEKTALTQACEGDWTKITLGLLLYVYPPPLSKANISQIMEEAVALCDDAGVSATFKYLSITREVMSGDVGSLLKYMYGRSVVYKVKSVHLSVVLLVSTVHLSILLAHGTNRPELLSPMLHTEGGDLPISFVTKVTLETVEALNQFETPVKVLLDYLRSSSSDCSHSLKEMLIDRIKQKLTDSSVLEVCDVLLESGLNSDRNSVLVERGMWWLQRGQHNPAIAFIQRGNSSSVAKITTPIKAEDVNEAEWLSNCVDFHINSYCQGSHNSTVAKAIHFFYLAGDMSRINILLEFTMWRCMSAVALCGDLFPGVTIVPPLPTPPSGMFTGSDASILSARGKVISTIKSKLFDLL